MNKKLCKSRKNKILDGVCGGIAEYFNIDPTIVRIIAVVLGLIKGFGVLAYIIISLIMPYSDSEDFFDDDDIDKMKNAKVDSEKTDSSTGKKSRKSEEGLHTDEEFNEFFKK